MENSINGLMKWRFACKHFKANQKLPAQDLNDILDSARLSPSSFGLQAWKFVVVTNDELKEHLKPVCYNQAQITEASALVFFCARTDVLGDNGALKAYMKKYKADLGQSDDEVKPFYEMVSGMVKNMPEEKVVHWVQRQVYIPHMVLMLAAAEKGIDSCPMEGFEPEGVAKVLKLPENLKPTVLVSLGYRDMEKPPKSRFNLEDVVDRRT